MPRAFIGVGSNIDPEENIKAALQMLSRQVRIAAVSTFYCTQPEGGPEQPPFYNGVVEVETDIPAAGLKQSILRTIEDQLGRDRTEDKYGPRTIDLDVLVYDDLVAVTDDMVIPDPQIPDRPFLAIPLYELAPDLVLPGSGVRLEEIARAFEGHNMEPLLGYTQLLRKDLMDGS